MLALQCGHVKRYFGAVKAIEDASLEVASGEIHGILGGNGSGKSTLAKILSGSVRPDGGRFTLYEKPFTPASPRDSRRRGIVSTSQELSLLDNLTVGENLLLSRLPRAGGVFLDGRALRSEAESALDLLNISSILDLPVSALSPDQKYLLELAKALALKPRLLIIDEITSALYRDEVEAVKKLLRQHAEKGCAILFITHRLPEIHEICDSVTIMRNGRTVGTYGARQHDDTNLLSLMTGIGVVELERERATGRRSPDEKRKVKLALTGYVIPGFTRPIDLSVDEGEIVGIAGLQGQGQSALVRGLFGAIKSPPCSLAGSERRITGPREAVRSGIAFISGDREQEGVFRTRSILENVRVVGEIVRRTPVKAEELLKKYNVRTDRPTRAVATLSGGNQQKVVISRWTGIEPVLLLADDPTKGIDVLSRKEIRQFLHELARRGTAVIFVSSDDEELVELTRPYDRSRILVMYGGQIVHTLTGDAITAENIALHAIPRKSSATAGRDS